MRLIPNDTSLDVYIIGDKSTLDEVQAQTLASPMVNRNYLDINKLLQVAGAEKEQSTPFADQLFLYYLLTSQPANCYALPKEMRYSRLRKMHLAMNSFSLLFLLSSFIYSGLTFMDGVTFKQQSEDSKNKADFYQTRYNMARERLPKTPAEPAQIKVAVDAAKTLNEYKSTPYEMLSFLGQALEQYPDIKIDELDWSFSANPDTSASVGVDKNTFKYFQVSNLKARIEPFDGNYREAIATVNKFAETLRSSESAYEVNILSFPLDISSTARLQGNAEGVGKEALFVIKAVVGVN